MPYYREALITVTDDNSLAGIAKAHVAARQLPIQLIVGARLHFQDAPSVLAWVQSRRGYANLCRLLTLGRRRAPKGECHLQLADLLSYRDDLLLGILPIVGALQQCAVRDSAQNADGAILRCAERHLCAPTARSRVANAREEPVMRDEM